MSNYIVLAKQVPDVSNITDNAFNPKTGTLVRSRLQNVINELDTHSLALANKMKQLQPDRDAAIVSLTMGPPMAESVLRYCLARAADTAILLTDAKLGGADTWATANPLAAAVRKIVKEIFHGNQDYYILCGMQSVDGDTAQVPPQIAEELDLPCIAYVTDAKYDNKRFLFDRIITGGTETVALKTPPAVITTASYEYPVFATFARSRKAKTLSVSRWTNEDINAPHIGVKGSKTSVIRVFAPGKSSRKAQQVPDAAALAEAIMKSLKESKSDESATADKNADYLLPDNRADKFDRSFEATEKQSDNFRVLAETINKLAISKLEQIKPSTKPKILSDIHQRFHEATLDDMLSGLHQSKPAYSGDVWVIAEQDNNIIHPATFELVGKARQLADTLETGVGVCIAGHNMQATAEELIFAGADKVYLIEHELLSRFDPVAYRKSIADCIAKHSPQIALFAATSRGRTLAPMVSYRLGCGLTADCTQLEIKDNSTKKQIAILLQTRPALGGNIMASICTKNSKTQMASARPGVMKRLPPDTSRTGQVIEEKPDLSADDISLEIIKTERASSQADLNAEIVVSGGKGMQSRDNYEKLVGSVCRALRTKCDIRVERGASRAAVEHGFVKRQRQVGQTGTSIGPRLYIALGISGAIQHMIGVSNAQTIIAINSDPNAPIFKLCDYYIVGKVETIIPELVESLESKL